MANCTRNPKWRNWVLCSSKGELASSEGQVHNQSILAPEVYQVPLDGTLELMSRSSQLSTEPRENSQVDLHFRANQAIE